MKRTLKSMGIKRVIIAKHNVQVVAYKYNNKFYTSKELAIEQYEESKEIYKLTRVSYGRKDTPKEDREYKINGIGPVGTKKEFEEKFPDCEFIIEDKISIEVE